MRIAVHVFDDAEELDWVGPWEVFTTWAMFDDTVEVISVAREAGVVRCAKGLEVVAQTGWEELGPVDLVVYPGGRGTRAHLGDEAIRSWVRDLHAAGTTMVSVCTGSLVYADAGLLDGRPATTHWGTLDRLGELGRDLRVRPDDRFVDDGDVVTAAGVSAGIDVALHLVARFAGADRAREVRRYLQYDPQPPV
ncbi:DJ-1/PfpI family protein [Egicoccus halophilus]|uniref:Putative transcription regulator, AraC family protein n=1 Tax=Egicoccus halophilus TaxID=1670830 RepID=A0A8J3A954_9ACTN|nr:DJ-1/PfpI family protein [Egicoccus halophilus]GGI07141.1 putative transcription regulator, AraC family protein [Egicoccus halophilus]